LFSEVVATTATVVNAWATDEEELPYIHHYLAASCPCAEACPEVVPYIEGDKVPNEAWMDASYAVDDHNNQGASHLC
jgi:hypothetical protein